MDEERTINITDETPGEIDVPALEAGGKEIPALTPEDTIKALEEKVVVLEKESKENYERFVRVTADFDNFRKRAAREKEDLRKYANESALKELLSLVDNLERAIISVQQGSAGEGILKGLDMTLKEALSVFERHGVKPFESTGTSFDPRYHQAMMREETDSQPDNTVLSEFQKGYMIHDRLLRPAMVVVSKIAEKGDGEGNNNLI